MTVEIEVLQCEVRSSQSSEISGLIGADGHRAQVRIAPTIVYQRLLQKKSGSALRHPEDFNGTQPGSVTRFHAELHEDALEMSSNGGGLDAENRRHFRIRFSLRNPNQDFAFARSKPEPNFQRFRTPLAG